MNAKRSRMEIIHDILSVISKFQKAGPTKIIYKANLSHQRFKEYMTLLEDGSFVERTSTKAHNYFILTLKGKEFLQKLGQVQELSEAFGLPI